MEGWGNINGGKNLLLERTLYSCSAFITRLARSEQQNFDSRWRYDFPLSHFVPALRLTPLAQSILGLNLPKHKAYHTHLPSDEDKNAWVVTSTLPLSLQGVVFRQRSSSIFYIARYFCWAPLQGFTQPCSVSCVFIGPT
jgi:hypothetical protein